MNTPICDFVRAYAESEPVRMHMPGHKGITGVGPEAWDLTEIDGADELYRSAGIIRESERNASALFGTSRTVYSAEGSSLCIRAMLYLAVLTAGEKGLPRRLLAGRNAHRTLMTAAALLDMEIDWLMPAEEEDLLSGRIRQEELEEKLCTGPYMAVYLTSPDYLGNQTDVKAAAEACRRHGVPLLVDNAHGAYLKFLGNDRHPITLGVAACCDSAHKTLACLTGAAYLHLGENAPAGWAEQAEQAMSLFASTSPSWLILQSLDRMNRELDGTWRNRLKRAADRLAEMKNTLRREGWVLIGSEPLKLTLDTGARGYTGQETQALLKREGIVCEYADRSRLVLMPSAETPEKDWPALEKALRGLERRPPLSANPPLTRRPEMACSIREAMLSARETVPVREAAGRILADAAVSCPPAVPVAVAGERITQEAAECMKYYGISECQVVMDRRLQGA